MSTHRTKKLRLTDGQRKILEQFCQYDFEDSLPEMLNCTKCESLETFESDLQGLFRLGFIAPLKHRSGQRSDGFTEGEYVRLNDDEFSSLFPLNRFLVLSDSGWWQWLVDGEPRQQEVGDTGFEGLICSLAVTRKGTSFFWDART